MFSPLFFREDVPCLWSNAEKAFEMCVFPMVYKPTDIRCSQGVAIGDGYKYMFKKRLPMELDIVVVPVLVDIVDWSSDDSTLLRESPLQIQYHVFCVLFRMRSKNNWRQWKPCLARPKLSKMCGKHGFSNIEQRLQIKMMFWASHGGRVHGAVLTWPSRCTGGEAFQCVNETKSRTWINRCRACGARCVAEQLGN